MTPAETAVGALLDAISAHLPAVGPGPMQDVRLACAAVIGAHCDQAAIERFTRLLGDAPAVFTPACQSCGNTEDLDPVHFPAAYGIAGRVEWYCHQPGPCADRRHGHLVATSLGRTA